MKKEKIEKQNNASQLGEEPVFNINRMPKGYKVGRFEPSSNKLGEDNLPSGRGANTPPGNNKKIGIIIISLGVIIVLFLGYVIFSYIGNPNFSLANVFKFNNKDSQKVQVLAPPAVIPPPSIAETIIPIEEEEEIVFEEEIVDENGLPDDSDMEIINEINYVFIDNDLDGLSDEEEILLGTDFSMLDSDGDGYDDLTEILNLYNPIGDGRLNKNDNIAVYVNESFGYSVFYPVALEKSVLSDESSVIFSLNESSFIQILVEQNELDINIKNWYASRFFNLVEPYQFIEKNNWEGVYSEDGLAIHLMSLEGEKNIYTILYSVPDNQPLIYANIFKMIVNSFLADLSVFK